MGAFVFDVHRIWKGPESETIRIHVRSVGDLACGWSAKAGWTGVVFARQLGGKFVTSGCQMLPYSANRDAYDEILPGRRKQD